MTMMKICRVAVAGLAAAVAASMATAAAVAEERTVTAFAPITTTGQMLQTGTGHVSFTGTASGLMLIETENGLVNGGDVSCTINLEMAASGAETKGMGRCAVVGTQGNRIYGSYSCAGTLGLGCSGEFTVDGGTDEFAEGKGAGKFIIRSLVAETAFAANPAEPRPGADGVMIWRDLKISGSKTAPAEN